MTKHHLFLTTLNIEAVRSSTCLIHPRHSSWFHRGCLLRFCTFVSSQLLTTHVKLSSLIIAQGAGTFYKCWFQLNTLLLLLFLFVPESLSDQFWFFFPLQHLTLSKKIPCAIQSDGSEKEWMQGCRRFFFHKRLSCFFFRSCLEKKVSSAILSISFLISSVPIIHLRIFILDKGILKRFALLLWWG